MPPDTRSNFLQIQKWMQSVLISPEKNTAKAADFIHSSSRLTAERHLSIYRQSYIARLRECMKNQFVTLNYALGEELFQMFADQYLDAYPSDSYTLNDLGKKFPVFLAETRPDAESDEKESWIDFMIELANFEYSLSEIFDEQSQNDIIPADDSAPDEALKIVPVFYLFHHTYPVCRYYINVVKKKNPELPFEEKTYCAVTRCNYRLRLTEINSAQHFFLETLLSSKSIANGKICVSDKFGFDTNAFENLWQTWRRSFIAEGFFSL